MHRTVLHILSSALLTFACVAPAYGKTFYVSTRGNDRWSGQLREPTATASDGPLATLEGARDAIRRLRQRSGIREPVHVVVEHGRYTLSNTLVLEPRDSGTAQAPIIYEAAPGAHPVFSGGSQVTGFRQEPNGLWSTYIREVASGNWYFEQLFVNGRRAVRARSPNSGYYYMLRPDRYANNPHNRYNDLLAWVMFRARREDIAPLLSLSQAQLSDAVVVAYHTWEISRRFISSIDADNSVVTLEGTTYRPFFAAGPAPRYHVENVLSALDAPGEWFLARSGTLYYKPRAGEDMTTAEVMAPRIERLVALVGSLQSGKWVEHLTFRGLTFAHAESPLRSQGWTSGDSSSQAATDAPTAIHAVNARMVTFEHCEVGHIGGYAIWFDKGSTDSNVYGCYIHDLGAGGVRVGETAFAPDQDHPTGRIRIENNIFHSGGHIHYAGMPILVGHSGGNAIVHNEIADFKNSGISVGWVYGYAASVAVGNTIAYNRIRGLGQRILSDMGGIYTLGPSPGTIVEHNFISDVAAYDYGGWGFSLDEGSSFMVLRSNVVYGAESGALHIHYGRDNVVSNNVFVGSGGQLLRTRRDGFCAMRALSNIVYTTGGPMFDGAWDDAFCLHQHNLYFSTTGPAILYSEMNLAEWQSRGTDVGSINANPQFIDVSSGDLRLQSTSPAYGLGFDSWPYEAAGVYGGADWVALAASLTTPAVLPKPAVPMPDPLTIQESFEQLPLGAIPLDAAINVQKNLVGVTDEVAAVGRQSLRIRSIAGFRESHFYYYPVVTEGRAVNAWSVYIRPGTSLTCEWRDVQGRIGPRLSFDGPRLLVNGLVLLDVPTYSWTRVEISANVGSLADGEWNLVVTAAGQPARTFTRLKYAQKGWKSLYQLDWGVPIETGDGVLYLDEISLFH